MRCPTSQENRATAVIRKTGLQGFMPHTHPCSPQRAFKTFKTLLNLNDFSKTSLFQVTLFVTSFAAHVANNRPSDRGLE